MRVLVTGGAGYIGSITVRHLLDCGHAVVVLDSLERGHAASVDPRAWLIVGSVGDLALLDDILPDVDVVVHCAGYDKDAVSQVEPDVCYRKNLADPSRMLDRMVVHGVRKLVFSSTADVYGIPEQLPINEDAPCRPVSVYGASKLAFERLVEVTTATGVLDAVRLRYFNVAGAWPDGSLGEAHEPESHIVPRLLRTAAGFDRAFTLHGDDYPTPDGSCVRDYVHVLDLAEAHRCAVEYLAAGGESIVLNLGSGQGYSNREVARWCSDIIGREIAVEVGPRREGDAPVLVAANHRAGKILGWRPKRDLQEMVRDAWAWHSTHPHGYEGVSVAAISAES
ncbi:MAG: UDP-glucose 4-epimerase GalE [Coriobacteriia bacterium]|nr:UDP-glucose 4-epimerase GalE [Coriobacteriia bacterium]